jgi:putative membrane protein
MPRRFPTLSLLGVAAVATCLSMPAPGWAQSSGGAGARTPADNSPAAAPNAMSAAPASKLERGDQSMLRDIAEANLAEVASGQLALEKAKSDQVKQFAQMMVDDHSKALKDVEQLAQDKNVKLPSGPGVKHKAVMAELKMIKGDTFDKKYMAHAGLDDHKATLALLQKTQSQAKDPDLKALAGKMVPVVQEHLKHAQDAAKM